MASAGQQTRQHVLWCPNDATHFFLGGNDLSLREIPRTNKARPSNAWTDPNNTGATTVLRATEPEITEIKCLAASPSPKNPFVVASGLASGQLILADLSRSDSKIVKEFTPRFSRACLAVAWNPDHPNLIAGGLEKCRADPCTLVWDIDRQGEEVAIHQRRDSNAKTYPSPHSGRVQIRPFVELPNSDGSLALSWVPGNPFLLANGTASRWLRIYDIRESETGAPSAVNAHPRGVYGVVFNPLNTYNLATYSESGMVKLWDTRKMSQVDSSPISFYSFNAGKNMIDIQWSPTRNGVLGTLCRGESFIKLWDLRDAVPPKDQETRLTLESNQVPKSKHNRTIHATNKVQSFNWHHSDKNRIIALTGESQIEDFNVRDPVLISWSPAGRVVKASASANSASDFTFLSSDREHLNNKGGAASKRDICLLMQERARMGYELDVAKNTEIVMKTDPGVQNELLLFWNWVTVAREVCAREDHQALSLCTVGVKNILRTEAFGTGARHPSFMQKPKDAIPGYSVYSSAGRTIALHICGWASDRNSLASVLDRIIETDGYERAAAIATFHGELPRAIELLGKGAEKKGSNTAEGSNLQLIALALAGYSETAGATMWKNNCQAIKDNLQNPYLKATMLFLSSGGDITCKEILAIMTDEGLLRSDRVALGCRYENDDALKAALERMAATPVPLGERGNFGDHNRRKLLDMIILHGFSADGIELLEDYVDRTADVQTAGLASTLAFTPDKRDETAAATSEQWMDEYRRLLDRWQLWHERALLDVARVQITQQKPAPQIIVRCNFCGQGITHPDNGSRGGQQRKPLTARERLSGHLTGAAVSQKPKVSACANCRKSLPRCALCILPLGTSSAPHSSMVPTPSTKDHALSVEKKPAFWGGEGSIFDSWFTWCQTCRHGGHARHVLDWFEKHTTCPVSGCKCECRSKDFLN